MNQRDSRFERETSTSELQIKVEMERRLARHFEQKHGAPWSWCAICQTWGTIHEHLAISHG
jgi:hypothetical protein